MGDLRDYMALIYDQLADVATIHERADFTPLDEGGAAGDTSDLVDPGKANADWLAWLAQHVGITFNADTVPSERRSAIAEARTQWPRVGTLAAILDDVRATLTGNRRVFVGRLGAMNVQIRTYLAETPSTAATRAAALGAGKKPAGLLIQHVVLSGATYADLTDHFGDYGSLSTNFATYQTMSVWAP